MVAISRFLITVALLGLIAAPGSWAHTVQSPDFAFRSVDGPNVTADSVRGEVVIFAFGASWLPLTRNQMEGLKKVADQYAGRGVAVGGGVLFGGFPEPSGSPTWAASDPALIALAMDARTSARAT